MLWVLERFGSRMNGEEQKCEEGGVPFDTRACAGADVVLVVGRKRALGARTRARARAAPATAAACRRW